MNDNASQPRRWLRAGLFLRVAALCTVLCLISVGLGAGLFMRQVRVNEWRNLKAAGEQLRDELSLITIQKLGDETEMLLRCQELCRKRSQVRYIMLEPLSGESILVLEKGWSLEEVPAALRQEDNAAPTELRDPWSGQPVLHFSQHIAIATIPWGKIYFGLTLENYREASVAAIRNTLASAALCLLVGVAGAAWLARRISRPVTELSRLAARLAGGDLSARADVSAPGEIGDLASRMNRMASKIGASQRLLHERAQREHRLASLSSAFLTNGPERLQETFAEALKAIAGSVGMERASVCLYNEDHTCVRIIWSWGENGGCAGAAFSDAAGFPWSQTLASPQGVYALARRDELRVSGPDIMRRLENQGIESLLVSALGTADKPSGFLLLSAREPRPDWTQDEQVFVRFAAGILSNAVARQDGAAERDRLQSQLLQSQKMEAVGKLSGGIAHDFNNMLVPIMGYSDSILQSMPPDSPWIHELREIKRAAESAASLTRQLLAFSRKQIISRREVDINQLILTLRKMLARLIGENIQLTTRLAPDAWIVSADPGQIEQCLVNLCVNASHAINGTGSITLRTEMVDSEDPSLLPPSGPGPHRLFLRLSVGDTGCGMEESTLTRIFEPFYSTKGNEGTGLGLSVVHGIMEQHGGWVTVRSRPGAGTTFHLHLPALKEAQLVKLVEDTPRAPATPGGAGQKILLVEDEAGVQAFISAALRKNGYEVVTADCGAKARSAFAIHGDSLDLVISDVVLPDLSGVDLLEEFLSVRPDLRALLSSGYSEKNAVVELLRSRDLLFLHKPYSLAQLLETVHLALTRPHAAVTLAG